MASFKRPEITKHHVLRVTDWTYSCVLVIYGSVWAFAWARLALQGKSILISNSSSPGRVTTTTTLYPVIMWLFALCGAFVIACGIRNIRRLLTNRSIG